MKCVMIIEDSLPNGLIANTAAVLGISLSDFVKGLVGRDTEDRDGRIHNGITTIPIPILTADKRKVKDLYDSLLEQDIEEIKVIGFNDVAQKSLHYDDYESKLNRTGGSEMNLLGICLYGEKKKVNKLTGNLKMLR